MCTPRSGIVVDVAPLIKTVSVQFREKKIYFPFGILLKEFPKRITFDYNVLCRNAAAVSDGNRMMETEPGPELLSGTWTGERNVRSMYMAHRSDTT